VVQDRAEVTVLLPRRTFHRLSQRVLHDRTADRIAEAIGRIPHVAATIVPFDTTLSSELEEQLAAQQRRAAAEPALVPAAEPPEPEPADPAPAGCVAIGDIRWHQQVTVQGRITVVQVGTVAGRSLEVQLFDGTGGIRLLFFGRTQIAGLEPGTVLRATGRVGEYKGHLALANPRYELLSCAGSLA
jgi:hypothetical protein